MKLVREIVELRGGIASPVSPLKVEGWRFRDWAVHRQVEGGPFWNITLLPIGLRLNSTWASFTTRDAAVAAMVEIAGLRNSWHRVEQADLTRQLKAQLQRIVARHGAVKGPVGIVQRAGLNMLGLPAGRLNHYREYAQCQA